MLYEIKREVKVEPMSRDDAGYLINNITNAKPNTDFTEEQTTNEFIQTGNFPFGIAIEAMKLGHKVARSGWNGKGMYLVHFSPVSHGLEMLTVYDKEEGTTLPLLPFILMKTADNCYVPWLASQTDILAEDYSIVNFSDI